MDSKTRTSVIMALGEIVGHLGAAKIQRAPADDKIIADHISAAHAIALEAFRKIQEAKS